MAHFKYLLLTPCLLISQLSIAGEKVDQTLEVADQGAIFIENVRGSFTVTGWDKPQMKLQGELDDATRKLIFKAKGNKAAVKVVLKEISQFGHGSSLNLYIPRHSKVRFKGVDTHYQLADINGKIEGQSIKGDVDIRNIHGKLRLSSVSGNVTIIESSGHMQLETVNGKVDYQGAFSKAQIKSMSGSINANIDQTEKLKIDNVSGQIHVHGDLRRDADIKLNSVTGDIRYTATGEFHGECEIYSKFGGNIHNRLTEDKPWDEKLKQRKLKFVSGDGSGKLSMNTVSGNVILEK